jgi:hypothetical protein
MHHDRGPTFHTAVNDCPAYRNWFTGGYEGIRGGAIAKYDSEHMIHFFHSVKRDPGGAACYVGGALLFESEEPYEITRIIAEPLWKGPLMPPSIDRMCGPRASTFFPCGAEVDGCGFVVSAGVGDWKTAIMSISRATLEENFADCQVKRNGYRPGRGTYIPPKNRKKHSRVPHAQSSAAY